MCLSTLYPSHRLFHTVPLCRLDSVGTNILHNDQRRQGGGCRTSGRADLGFIWMMNCTSKNFHLLFQQNIFGLLDTQRTELCFLQHVFISAISSVISVLQVVSQFQRPRRWKVFAKNTEPCQFLQSFTSSILIKS